MSLSEEGPRGRRSQREDGRTKYDVEFVREVVTVDGCPGVREWWYKTRSLWVDTHQRLYLRWGRGSTGVLNREHERGVTVQEERGTEKKLPVTEK